MQSVLGFTAVDDAAAKMTVRLAETIEIEEKYFHSRHGRSGKFVKCVATAIDRAAEGPVSFVVEPPEYPGRPLYIATKSIKAAVWDVCCEEYYTSHPEALSPALLSFDKPTIFFSPVYLFTRRCSDKPHTAHPHGSDISFINPSTDQIPP